MNQILLALLLGGLMGMIGQGVRAVGGLKKMKDDAQSQGVAPQDLFDANRFVVSLMIGFIAGVLAASTMLKKLIAITVDDVTLLLGLAAAGYAGADIVESFAPMISGGAAGQTVTPNPVPGAPAPTSTAHVAGPASPPPAAGGVYGSLVPGGFFSADPYNLSVARSIRTNNPGAMNYTSWQGSRKGFVGITQPDSAGNKTTIYRTPEHGVAAWYHLLCQIYGYRALPTFTLASLAQRYAGAQSGSAVNGYIAGWTRWSNGTITATSAFNANDPSQMLLLAKAMFSHEAGQNTPVQDQQITFAIQNEQAGTLPS